jgi:hypothetical protein
LGDFLNCGENRFSMEIDLYDSKKIIFTAYEMNLKDFLEL